MGFGGFASFGGSLLQMMAQKDANDRNQYNFDKALKFNEKEAALNREQQSITEQYRQLRQAGINPVSGNATINTNASQAVAGGLPTIEKEDAFGKGISEFPLLQAQLDNLSANTQKTNEETEGQKHTNEILESNAKFADDYYSGLVKLNSSTTELNIAHEDAIDKKTPEEIQLLRGQYKQALANANEMTENTKLITSNIELNEKNKKRIEQDIKESISRELYNYAMRSQSRAERDYYLNLADKVEVECDKEKVEYRIDKFRYKNLKYGERIGLWHTQMDFTKGFMYSDKVVNYLGTLTGAGAKAMSTATNWLEK